MSTRYRYLYPLRSKLAPFHVKPEATMTVNPWAAPCSEPPTDANKSVGVAAQSSADTMLLRPPTFRIVSLAAADSGLLDLRSVQTPPRLPAQPVCRAREPMFAESWGSEFVRRYPPSDSLSSNVNGLAWGAGFDLHGDSTPLRPPCGAIPEMIGTSLCETLCA